MSGKKSIIAEFVFEHCGCIIEVAVGEGKDRVCMAWIRPWNVALVDGVVIDMRVANLPRPGVCVVTPNMFYISHHD